MSRHQKASCGALDPTTNHPAVSAGAQDRGLPVGAAASDVSDPSDLPNLTSESLAALGALARLLGRQVARDAAREEGGDV